MVPIEKFHEAVLSGRYETPSDGPPAKPLPMGLRSWWRFYVDGIVRAMRVGKRVIREGGWRPGLFGDLAFVVTKAVESTGATISFDGFDALAPYKGKPMVLVANHMSLVETMVLPAGLFAVNDMTVIAKRSLTKYPVFGKILASFHPILLDRKNPRKDLADTLSQGVDLLKEGISILLFPQGHRLEVFDPGVFNSLGAKLAARAGVPLVPIACRTDLARPGRIVKDFGPIDPSRPVRFSCGPVIPPDTPQREMQEKCIEHIVSALTGWGMKVKRQETEDVKGN